LDIEKPKSAAAVIPTLIAVTLPVPILRINSDDDKQIYVILTDEQLELALSLEQAITIETNN